MAEVDGSGQFIELGDDHWRSMLDDVQRRYPEEACGLLGGRANRVCIVAPVVNILKSSSRYRMDPQEQLGVFQQFDLQGMDVIGIYHSHPTGPSHPSRTDIEEAYYPEASYLIWSEMRGNWGCRAFRILSGAYSEMEIRLIPD